MSEFTPGPWRVGDVNHTVFGPPNGNPAPERIASLSKNDRFRANARLIAAAPELLEALYSMLNVETAARLGVTNSGAIAGLDWKYHFDKARAAIAKAEGKEE